MADTKTEKTVAEELKAAAKKLRDKAKNAPHGPWHIEGAYPQRISNPAAIVIADTFTGPDVPPYAAQWITLVSPELAEPLASWLEKAARDMAKAVYEDEGNCTRNFCEPGCDGHAKVLVCDECGNLLAPASPRQGEACSCWDAALAVARVLNGTAS